MSDMTSIAKCIDHTILRADLTKKDIFQHCQEAIKHRFKAVCIPPYFVKYAKDLTRDTQTVVCTVVGFPLGYSGISAKIEEAKSLLAQGCDELDFVINIAAVKNENWKIIDDEFDRLVTITHMKNKQIKAIIETCLLNNKEIEILCNKALEHNVDFVKTSTGMSTKGAEEKSVKLIKSIVGDQVKIKASGGIKTLRQVEKFLSLGVDRIGTSSGVKIMNR